MIEFIGIIGAICFSICAAPQALVCYKQGHAQGLNKLTLWLWFVGEVSTIVYVLETIGWDSILMSNYIINLLFLIIIIKFAYWERK